jgi:RNA-directed DNA polymerase
MQNLIQAQKTARKKKQHQAGVKIFDRQPGCNLIMLHNMLADKTYRTGEYKRRFIFEPKKREISILQYFPHRIAHHAAMNKLEHFFVSLFTTDTYSCIKGRGIHAATYALRKALKDKAGTTYCLKLDIKQFYPSIDHEILKQLLRKKLKDNDLLWLTDEIIDSAPGLPIGNYLSQYFANFYLTYFDHWLKETQKVKYYFRYADDLVLLSHSKEGLHQLLAAITQYLQVELKLIVKSNAQVFPVNELNGRGIDFVGYVHYHTHVLLRKTIKQNFARMMARRPNRASIASYNGWAKHCNSLHLIKKLTYDNSSKIIQQPRDKIKDPDW